MPIAPLSMSIILTPHQRHILRTTMVAPLQLVYDTAYNRLYSIQMYIIILISAGYCILMFYQQVLHSIEFDL